MLPGHPEHNASDPGGMFAWADATLSAAAAANETVWLLGHVPLGGPSAPDIPGKQTLSNPGPVLNFDWNQVRVIVRSSGRAQI
jgi:hypothetical protein